MEIALAKLRETRGEVAIHLTVIVLAATLLVAAAMQVNHVYGVIDRVKDKTNEAVATANIAGVFPGGRESDWLSRQHVSTGSWSQMVSTDEVVDALARSLSAVSSASSALTVESFTLSNIHTHYDNAEGGHLNFTTTMNVVVPISFGQPLIPHIQYRHLLVFALLALAISLFGISTRSMKLHVMSSELVRYIEVRGQVDSGVYAELARLKDVMGMDVDCEITADYMSGGAHIQFGGLITVRLQYRTSFDVGGVLFVPMTLTATVTGRSEQYWK